MSRDRTKQPDELSRREFLAGTGGVIAGAAAAGLTGKAEAGEPKPGKGGTVRFATRSDAVGLDPLRIKLSYLTCSYGFKPRARLPYRAHIPQ
jgi:hypothetical protein